MNSSLEMLEVIAGGLQDLLDEVVFVGGATVALYATDPAAPEARPTDDVDFVIEISSRLEYSRLEEKLRALVFVNDTSQSAPLCRWIYRGIKVDAMPTDPKILGFANRWCADAVANSTDFTLPSSRVIRILKPSYFLATKLEAFQYRGKSDIRLSPDFEDVVFLLDNRPAIVDEVRSSDLIVKEFIQGAARSLIEDPQLTEAIEGALGFGSERGRAQRIVSALSDLINPQ
jgi:hypothetical protein